MSGSHHAPAHIATAIAETDVEYGVINAAVIAGLMRSRPDIGATVFRNLALCLAQKLERADGPISPPPHSPVGEPDVC